MPQGIFPWSKNVPYEWSRWFAWYPVRDVKGRLRRGWVYVRARREIVTAPDGFASTNEEFEFR